MSDNKHTPGPWTEHDKGEHRYAFVCGPETEFEFFNDLPVIAYITGPSVPANRRLIAAAPDLLEALKAMLPENNTDEEHCRSDFETCEKARDAIRKAEGNE